MGDKTAAGCAKWLWEGGAREVVGVMCKVAMKKQQQELCLVHLGPINILVHRF